jgi:hypothetical protein
MNTALIFWFFCIKTKERERFLKGKCYSQKVHLTLNRKVKFETVHFTFSTINHMDPKNYRICRTLNALILSFLVF